MVSSLLLSYHHLPTEDTTCDGLSALVLLLQKGAKGSPGPSRQNFYRKAHTTEGEVAGGIFSKSPKQREVTPLPSPTPFKNQREVGAGAQDPAQKHKQK